MTWRHSDKYVFLHLIDGECLPNDLIICKGFSFRTEDSLYAFEESSEMIPLVKRDAGTLLRDARDLLAGHFLMCPYMRDARDLLAGHFVMCPYMRDARDLLAGHVKMRPASKSRASRI